MLSSVEQVPLPGGNVAQTALFRPRRFIFQGEAFALEKEHTEFFLLFKVGLPGEK